MSAGWKWVIGVVSIVVVFALLACGIFFGWRFIFAGKPSVVITAPPSNYQAVEGEEVRVEARATGRSIVRMELWVDDGLVDSAMSPGPQDTLSAALTWQASGAGRHTLEVKAYSLAGRESDAAGVIISVVPTVAEVTPTPTPTPTPAPGATATPTETSTPEPADTPTPTATPTETPVPPTPTSPLPSCPAEFTVSAETPGFDSPFDLNWHVENATALHLSGPEVGDHVGVTGPGGSRTVCCPGVGTHTYTLHVSCPAGDFDKQVTVEVQWAWVPIVVDFTAAYDNIHECSGVNYVTFRVENTGTLVLESSSVMMPAAGGPGRIQSVTHLPFHPGPNGCGHGNDSLAPGGTAYITAQTHASTAQIILCTEENLEGFCAEHDVEIPGGPIL